MEKAFNHGGTVSFHVTNCDARTAHFISGIIGLFCDPEINKTLKEELLSGHFGVTGAGTQVRVFAVENEKSNSQSGLIYPNQQ